MGGRISTIHTVIFNLIFSYWMQLFGGMEIPKILFVRVPLTHSDVKKSCPMSLMRTFQIFKEGTFPSKNAKISQYTFFRVEN